MSRIKKNLISNPKKISLLINQNKSLSNDISPAQKIFYFQNGIHYFIINPSNNARFYHKNNEISFHQREFQFISDLFYKNFNNKHLSTFQRTCLDKRNYSSSNAAKLSMNNNQSIKNFKFIHNIQKNCYTTKGNPFKHQSQFKKLFENSQYKELVHQYREAYMVRYDINEPLKPNGFPKTVDTVYYLNALAKLHQVRELYEAFRYLLNPKNPSSQVFNTMLKCLLDLNLYDDAAKLYLKGVELHEKNKSILNARSINVLLKYFLKHSRFDDMSALYEKHCHANESDKIRIPPNSKTIGLLCKMYIKRNDLSMARQIIENECLRFRVNPDSDSVHRLMKANISRNNLETAYWIFIDFFTEEPESEASNPFIRLLGSTYPSSKVLCTLLRGYYDNYKSDEALNIFYKFCSPRKAKDEVINFKNGEAINEIVEREISPLFTPNHDIIKTMIQGLSKNKKVEEAENIYTTFFRGEHPPLKLKVDIAEEMLSMYSYSGSKKSQSYFQQHFYFSAKGHGFKPTPNAILSYMWYLQNSNNEIDAATLFLRWRRNESFDESSLPLFLNLLQKIVESLNNSFTITETNNQDKFIQETRLKLIESLKPIITSIELSKNELTNENKKEIENEEDEEELENSSN